RPGRRCGGRGSGARDRHPDRAGARLPALCGLPIVSEQEELPMANVRDIMTPDPICCTADDDLRACAQMMVDSDCGSIPVVDDQAGRRLVGIITDRDITCRCVAQGRNPLELKVRDCMTSPVDSIYDDASLDEVVNLMQVKAIRRVPV